MNWFWDNILLKKEERSGMFAFISILFCLLLVKWYMVVVYKPQLEDYSHEILASMEFTYLDSLASDHEPINKASKSTFTKYTSEKNSNSAIPKKDTKIKRLLFDFDPNSTSIDSLLLLGIGKYAATNIVKYREKGGQYKNPQDLQKVYGLDSTLLAEIQPHVKIKTPDFPIMPKEEKKESIAFIKPKVEPKVMDINLADTTDLKTLKGIGSVYANRIVKFRNSLGGYFSVDQIKEVWGISDSLFTSIKPYLKIDPSHIKKRNINLFDQEILVKHPYIDWKKAKCIMSYKKMHGDFKSMDDFEKLHGLDDAFVDTLKQYFIAQ